MLRALVHASEVLTGTGIRSKDGRRVLESDLGRIEDGAVVYECRKVRGVELPGKIVWVGPTADLPSRYRRVQKTDLKRARAIVPGFVDCHNHLVFAGDRSDEFAARCGGASYAEIAAKGGGIAATVRATRSASIKELEDLAAARLAELQGYGVRTVEVKSGYGLSLEAELKQLEVVPLLRKRFPQLTFKTTFLGAHAFPPEKSHESYLQELIEEMLPTVVRRKLADACDVFVDEGYFSVDQARRLLSKAKKLGLAVKVHADELGNTGAAQLAAALGALSADHLLKISDEGVERLAKSQTVAVLLPGTAFYLKAAHAPARKLLDRGACVALATDFNPGTCVTLSLPVVMTIAALYLGMTRSEIFAAVTYNAAKALGLEDRKGTLDIGRDADFTVLPFARFEETYYRFAWSPVAGKVRAGRR